MSGANEVPPNDSNGIGSLTGTYDSNTGMIVIDATYSDLEGNLTASHLHQAAAGSNGGVIVNLNPTTGATSGTISGTFAIPSANEASLINGDVYINLHSTVHGGGELRGQLYLVEVIPDAECEVEVEEGDICVEDNAHGIILKSPNGTCFRLQVNDEGEVTSTAVSCP